MHLNLHSELHGELLKFTLEIGYLAQRQAINLKVRSQKKGALNLSAIRVACDTKKEPEALKI